MERDQYPEMKMTLNEIIKLRKHLPKSHAKKQYKRKKTTWFSVDAREIIIAKQRSRIVDARDIINQKKLCRDECAKLDASIKERERKFQNVSLNVKDRIHKKYHGRGNQNKRYTRNVESVAKVKSSYVDFDDMTKMEKDEEEMGILEANNMKKKLKPVTESETKDPNEEVIEKCQLKLDVSVRNQLRFNYKPTPMGSQGFRLLVSNLDRNVTSKDMYELFGDIGPLTYATIIRPGTAEVIYKSLKDAEKAVDAYHNRKFDDKPMYCVLVAQHKTNRCVLRSGTRTLFTSNHPDTVDLDAVHAALFGTRH